MPPVSGTVVGGAIVPTDSADTYPVTDPQWGKGGAQFKTTTANRNAISVPRLEKGMLVFCEDTGITYRLKNSWAGGATSDADWEAFGNGTITGAGNVESVAFWMSPTNLGSNIFFTRSNLTSIVNNSQGFSTATGVVMDRYIDPAGSDSNTGMSAGPANAWQTPAFAMTQCPSLSSGTYRIHCAAGTYSLASISVVDTVNNQASPQYGNSLIEFVGDDVTPANVVFDNNGTIITANSPNTRLRMSGIRFTGAGGNICIDQGAGTIFIHSCEFDNFTTISQSRLPVSLLYLENGLTIPITNCPSGFTASVGATIACTTNVTMTMPLGGDSLFNISGKSTFAAIGSNAYTVNGTAGGYFLAADNSTMLLGGSNQYNVDHLSGFFILQNESYGETVEGIQVNISNCADFFEVRGDSYFNDSSDTAWTITSAPAGILLANGSQVSSGAALNGGPDLIINHLTYFPETNSRFASDNRYVERICFTAFGELPQGYGGVGIGPNGVSGTDYPIYVATENCEVIAIAALTRISNGATHTDTYTVVVNGTPSALAVPLTNSTANFATSPSVPLTAGDQVSVRFTSDAATAAQDITIEILVRRT